ncbi:UbiA family prenyltransferase [Frateuria sp. MAH-13]|uniref:UbiA family prenyltransferase n=1 Tax=Frateuria flava TaxID=2821489 RepID=A0ABS4DQY5_9GAMM|nr:UbiA family prenyltransferase [Frateuria flava]MBP1475475.1 UbiA family prenyltransferase [Frateuria flava]
MEDTIRPLCVDLDGTLIHTDLLIESALLLLRSNPLFVFAMLAWLFRGRAVLKREIAARVTLDPKSLPYNTHLLAWLKKEATSRPLVLVTASDAQFAHAVASEVGLFEHVIASNGRQNMSGSAKARRLLELYGHRQFDYAGNEAVDLKVWTHSHTAIVVSTHAALRRKAAQLANKTVLFAGRKSTSRHWIRALRLHQWVKNFLVFVPLLAAHQLLVGPAFWAAAMAFLSFGLCASGVYVLNDLLDLSSDRAHRTKRNRPFAAGTLDLKAGIIAIPALTAASLGLALSFLPRQFLLVLLLYLATTVLYSFKLKRVPLLDVVVLAGLYTVRIVAGTVAIASVLSFWLLAFAIFIFLSLATMKRCVELYSAKERGLVNIPGRAYQPDDLFILRPMGMAAGYLSVLVLALYINSPTSNMLYRHPQWLWLICPCLLYWVSRAWFIAHRGLMTDDPIVFAVRDRTSQLVLATTMGLALLAL